MPRDALKTLFYPFEAELLAMPGQGMRALFIGAEPGFRKPQGFDARLSLVQGFRPHVLALAAAGHDVAARAEDNGFDITLVLAGRHRGLNELRVAEAIERVAPGGLIVVAGGKEDGISSLRKRLGGLLEIEDHLPKYHGTALWFHRTAQAEAAAATLRADNPEVLVEGRFRTAPGMFSFERIDAGSRLLVDNLPADIKGKVADFCAGWGYVAAEVVSRAKELKALDLFEADFEALEAARSNVAATSVQPGFHWQDLAKEPVERRYDVVVMNPPFHQDRDADPEIGHRMIKAAAAALKPGGRLFMVANRHLPYMPVLAQAFFSVEEIAVDNAFRVYSAKR
ncbi:MULTISPECIES: class I SAM-dependent methyltransferase [Aminobacter]|uniref:16S rRNA (Guanine1207-N2)-methyltransferase n=1 Tax=Aminobacter ciceronei TaxID=150723 RepID=A0ABR6CAZ6_9HYPH|nr:MULTISPECIES: class I SAM-dependent methyltransferase [Aminobacter]MBA8908360.1 16S rRNA (guanine1207-N2)-methyltransferase [Aminobacter ciceronei]MBA9022201.1 16S rRNA (guanine1207-N2)-methyltransferase [Aminobacter ciceronei]MRX34846.1 methyltransferase [Aminobacter sp. MDW-2]QNH34388.1 class I SAM-dependent methyltransferase [Aminobacter sp. MDW-2]